MLLKWDSLPEEDRNGLILGYTVIVSESGMPVLHQNITETEFLVESLQPFTVYSLSVAAFTSVGVGPRTHQVATTCEDGEISVTLFEQCTTICSAFNLVPSEPLMLQQVNVTSSLVTLSWSPPAEPNGIVRHYLVLVKETDTKHNRTVVAHSNYHFTIGGLHPYYIYEFSVRAITIASGPPSVVLSVQTLQDGKFVC